MRNWIIALLVVVSTGCAGAQKKSRVLIVTGANNHDWAWSAPRHKEDLEATGKFEVTVTTEPGKTLAAGGLDKYDVLFLDYNGKRWGAAAEKNFLEAVKGGVGVAVIHASNNAFPGWKEYEIISFLCWRKGTGHGRFHPFDVAMTDRDHPITAGLPDIKTHPDELYHRLVHMHDAPFRVLGTAFSDPKSGGTGKHEPMVMVSKYGKGRIFHTPLGHVWKNVGPSRASINDPQFKCLVARGTEWAATGGVTLKPESFGLKSHVASPGKK